MNFFGWGDFFELGEGLGGGGEMYVKSYVLELWV